MAGKSPFVVVKVACPACGTVSDYRYLKSRLYETPVVDKDNYPMVYQWADPKYADIVAHHFTYWLCPKCLFVDTEEGFRKEAVSSKQFSLLREKLAVAHKEKHPVIGLLKRLLKGGVELETIEDAYAVHLMGVFEHSLLTENMRDAARLSRLLLHLSWLYRDARKTGQPLMAPDRLEKIRQHWPLLPGSRQEAIAQARAYYRVVLDRQVPEDDYRRRVTLMFLLAEFELLLGNTRDAMAQCNAIFRLAVAERDKATDVLLTAQTLDGRQANMLRDCVRMLKHAIEKAHEFKERAEALIVKLEKPKAMALLSKHPDLERDGTKALLFDARVCSSTISEVLKERFR